MHKRTRVEMVDYLVDVKEFSRGDAEMLVNVTEQVGMAHYSGCRIRCEGGRFFESPDTDVGTIQGEGERECRWHGAVAYDHVCVRPGESSDMATARAFGEVRDV